MTDQLDAIADVGPSHIELVPLSFAQLGIWYAQQLAPNVPFNIAQYVEGDNPDLALLPQALQIVEGEVESLRVRLVEENGQPFQAVQHGSCVDLEFIDVRDSPDPHAEAHAWMRADYRRPLNLRHDALIRAAMIRLTDSHWYCYMRVHHITFDGYGATQVVNRLFEVYTALWHRRTPEPRTFGRVRELYDAEFAYRDSSRFYADREYWTERVARIAEPTTLSSRTGGPGVVSLLASASYDGDRLANIDAAAARTGSSRAGVLLAAFAAYLSQVLDREDVVVSLPVAARTTAMTRRSAGMFANILPLLAHIDQHTPISDLVAGVGTEVIGALRHQRYRQEDIRRDSPIGAVGREFFGPRVNVMLFDRELQYGPQTATLNILMSGGLEDIGVNLYHSDHGERVHIDFEGNPNLYTQAEIDIHHARFLDFLDRFAAADPATPVARLSVLTAEESASVVSEWNDTAHAVPRTTLSEVLRGSFEKHADQVAVIDDSADPAVPLTYAELAERVNRLARLLIGAGVGPESVVAVAMRRSVDLVVAMNAVLQAGGAYVPIDPDHPAERNTHILSSAKPRRCWSRRRPVRSSTRNAESSTSRPKMSVPGPELRSPTPIAPLPCSRTTPPTSSTPRVRPGGPRVSRSRTTRSSTSRCGCSTVQHRRHGRLPAEDRDDVRRVDVGLLPAADGRRQARRRDARRSPRPGVRVVGDHPPRRHRHRLRPVDAVGVGVSGKPRPVLTRCAHVFVIGEALPAETVARFRRDRELPGCTTSTDRPKRPVSITSWPATPRDVGTVPIGVPEWNSTVLVLDSRLRPTPVGASGRAVPRGTAAGPRIPRTPRPDLRPVRGEPVRRARRADVPHRRPGALAVPPGWPRNALPALDYIGRTDFQVKFRGQRIELGEIEAALLRATDRCKQAAVLVVTEPSTGQQLVGYVVLRRRRVRVRRGAAVGVAPGRSPVTWFRPRSSDGELPAQRQRQAGPQGAAGAGVPRHRNGIPGSAHRAEEIWPRSSPMFSASCSVGIDDNFFDLGGNSLIAHAGRLARRSGVLARADDPRPLRGADRRAPRRCVSKPFRARRRPPADHARAAHRPDSALARAATDVVPQPDRHLNSRRTTCRSRCSCQGTAGRQCARSGRSRRPGTTRSAADDVPGLPHPGRTRRSCPPTRSNSTSRSSTSPRQKRDAMLRDMSMTGFDVR